MIVHVHTYTNLPYMCMEVEGVYIQMYMYVHVCKCMCTNVCAPVDSYMEYYATHSMVYDLLWVLLFDAFSLFTFCRVKQEGCTICFAMSVRSSRGGELGLGKLFHTHTHMCTGRN